jgi:hypothetical protein
MTTEVFEDAGIPEKSATRRRSRRAVVAPPVRLSEITT